ncbi:MAG TPA: dTDP-4-dehydrorhamnose reductase [Pyrinomonadaceae bacterium]|jgi:dTDP-4-dehydrorhamnose reductase|nr:dTDP-4-dehydrorhamnose reductase [Pyrinomonadaceae bacterium]
MKILITGANGMVAKATANYCRSIGDETLAVTRQELDIAARSAVFEIFKREKFEAVVNCAAFTDVDGAETNRKACAEANIEGVENLALAAREIDCAFVTISTDYVFDGAKSGFYTQRDTPNPQGFYAQSKLEGEMRARNAYARSIIVRSGWIYGHGGTNFLSVMDKLLADGRSIKAIYDSYGTPTFANDLAKRLRELAELDLPCLFHVTNSGMGTSYKGFAEKVCRLKGFDVNLLEPASADSLKRPAPRPLSSKLACLFSEKFGLEPLPHWEDALREFLM